MPIEPQMRASPEFELIARIRERLAGTGEALIGIGDDAAVTVPGGTTATTIDAIVEGVHFRSSWCPPVAVGRKAMAAALSDLAAMGARAGEAYVWLGMPDGFGEQAALELCDGIAATAEAAGAAVLGGDLSRASELAVCVTAIGHAPDPAALIGRSGGRPGCAVCLTGALGGAGAALLALEHPEIGESLEEEQRERLLARQLAPTPRLDAGQALARAGALAMIDLSDGLAADAEQLAAASGVAVEIELARVPIADGVERVAAAAGRDPLELTSAGGEDYELLCALPPEAVGAATDAVAGVGGELTEIGSLGPGSGALLRRPDGRPSAARGFDHLVPRSAG